MILFSARINITKSYYNWLSGVGNRAIKDCPETFIIFLLKNNLLDEKKVDEYLKELESEVRKCK